MAGRLFKTMCGFVLPGSALFALCLWSGRVPQVASVQPRILRLSCLAVIAAGLLLSTLFRRSRLFFAILTVFLGYISVEWLVPRMPSTGSAQVLVNATAALVALNLSVLSLLRDRGVISPPGLRRLLLVTIQAGTVIAITLPSQARAAELLQRSFIEPRFTEWSRISQPAMVVFAAAAVLLLIRLGWRRRPVDNGLFWALATVFVGFSTRAQAFGIYVAAAALILLHVWRPTLARESGLQFKLLLAAYLLWRLLIDGLKPVPYEFAGGLSGIQLVCAVALALYLPVVARQFSRLRT